ncbi:hypothetical protein ACWDRB_40960 [Nonomuraea sp. NPDC003707]
MAEPEVALHLTLAPTADTVTVTARFGGLDGSAGRPFLQVPRIIASVSGQDYHAEDVIARDERGELHLTEGTSDPEDVGALFSARTFIPARDTVGEVTLTYRATIVPAFSPRRPGPSFDLRGIDGGFAGAFSTFLILPADLSVRLRLAVAWAFEDGEARGFTTRGAGDFTADLTVPEVLMTFLIAGPVRTLPEKAGKAPFNAYWIGEPPFAVEDAMAWCTRAHEALTAFFRAPSPAPYHFILRPHPNRRDGGAATNDGFMLEYGTGPHTEAARRYMFLHEMVHHFVGTLDGPPGSTSWYSEGLAEHYKIKIAAEAKLLDRHAHEAEVRTMTHAYYTSPRLGLPYAEVPGRYWSDSHVQGIAYNRGFMYFADLDALIRERSGGSRSLDDLVLAMVEDRRAGRPCDEALWRAKLRAELGEAGITHFERMLAGDVIVPPDEAFGADLTRVRRRTEVRRLGFTDRSLTNPPLVIAGLEPACPAAAAGLREGDAVIAFHGAEPSVLHSTEALVLEPEVTIVVAREGGPQPITFATWAGGVPEHVWEQREVEHR